MIMNIHILQMKKVKKKVKIISIVLIMNKNPVDINPMDINPMGNNPVYSNPMNSNPIEIDTFKHDYLLTETETENHEVKRLKITPNQFDNVPNQFDKLPNELDILSSQQEILTNELDILSSQQDILTNELDILSIHLLILIIILIRCHYLKRRNCEKLVKKRMEHIYLI